MNEKISSPDNRSCSGFTLIEMLIITAILGFVGYMIYGSLNISRKLYDNSLDKTEALQQIRYSINSISKDIQNVVRTSSSTPLNGIKGDFSFDNDSFESDLLSLKLLPGKSAVDVPLQNSEITVKYFVDYDKEKKGAVLKKETILKGNPDIQKRKKLCNNIRSLKFRYLQNGVWCDEWKSKSLPDAVEITIIVETRINKSLPDKLQTVVTIIS